MKSAKPRVQVFCIRSAAQKNFFLWLAVISAVMICAGCDAHTGAFGRVTDESRDPIAGAEVRLISLKTGKVDLRTTEQDAKFVSEIIHGWGEERFVLTISKPGYFTFRQAIEAKTTVDLNVVLTPTHDSPKQSKGEAAASPGLVRKSDE
jgi:hypothetical protein